MSCVRVALAAAALLLAALTSCSSVQYEFDAEQGVDFGAYTTWAWQPRMTPVSTSARFASGSAIGEAIDDAIAEDLTGMGLERVAPNDAELLVTWHIEITRVVKRYANQGYSDAQTAYANQAGGLGAETTKRSYRRGRLEVQVIDKARGETVWMGSAEARVRTQTPLDQAKAETVAVVHKIMKRCPIKTASKR